MAARRKQLGLTREQLAQRIGASSQTVLNVESNEDYNLGTAMLRRLEPALGVEFRVEMKEESTMSDRVRMGNDEFILHIRKNWPECQTNNRVLGKRIWEWIQAHAAGVKLFEVNEQPCKWGSQASNIDERGLPKTATQFEFDLIALPDLFRLLAVLGQE